MLMSWLNACVRVVGGIAFVLLMLLAMYVSLGRELMPLVSAYQKPVIHELSAALGVPLQVGSLRGGWVGLNPVLLIDDLSLGDPVAPLQVRQLRIVPDVLESLLQRRFIVAGVHLYGVQLNVTQTDQETWSLQGLEALFAGAVQSATSRASLADIEQISVQDSQISIRPLWRSAFTLRNLTLHAEISGGQMVEGRFTIPNGLPVVFRLDGVWHPEHWQHSDLKLYMSLPQAEWADYLPASLYTHWHIARLKAGGELWGQVDQGKLSRMVVRIDAPELLVAVQEQTAMSIQDTSATLYLDQTEHGYDMRLDSLAFSLGEERVGPIQMQGAYQSNNADGLWQMRLDRLQVAPLNQLAQALLPANQVIPRRWLSGLQPQGSLYNLEASFDTTQAPGTRLKFAANFSEIGIEAYREVPGIANLSGAIQGTEQQGMLDIRAEQFALHIPTVFAQPWQYQQARGRLHWVVDTQQLQLFSAYMQLDDAEARLTADMNMLLHFPADQFSTLDLRVGLVQGQAAALKKYIPKPSDKVNSALVNWLRTAIVGGTIAEGLFQHQGTLSTNAPKHSSSLSLYVKAQDAELAYQPQWPALKKATGAVWVEPSGVVVALTAGQLLNSQAHQVLVEIPATPADQPSWLKLSAQLSSSVADVLKLLQTAPLGMTESLENWQGQGDLTGTLALEMPLQGNQAPKVQVALEATKAELQIAQPSLHLSDIQGQFLYDSAKGLSASKLRASVFKRPIQGKIIAEGTAQASRSRIVASGAVATKDLIDWLAIKQPLPFSGVLPYQLELLLAKNSQLNMRSTLKGVAIDMPAPFGKTPQALGDMRLKITASAKDSLYQVHYGDLATLVMQVPQGKMQEGRGTLLLGAGTPELPSQKGVWVQGSLSELDVADWQLWVKNYIPSGPSQYPALFKKAQVQIGRVHGWGVEDTNLTVDLAQTASAWSVGLSSAVVQGKIDLPDQPQAPIVVALNLLRLPQSDTAVSGTASRKDPLAAIQPAQLPAVDVQIEQLFLGSSLLGSTALKMRPVANGVAFSELALNLKGLQLTGAAGWTEQQGQVQSWYKGRAKATDIGAVLKAWNYAPSATSERFRVNADIQWPGSIAALSMAQLSGTLKASMDKGSFTEVGTEGTNALRVFGLLNLGAIGRRLQLDFSDLFGKGVAYDRTKVLLKGVEGVFVTAEPLEIKGPSMLLNLNGTLDAAQRQINAKLDVILPLSNTVALGALLVGSPVLAGAIFVADKVANQIFGAGASNLAKVQYKVSGPIDNPTIRALGKNDQ